VLYEMLSGRRAFTGSSTIETMNAILKENPEDLDERVGRALPGLPAIVLRCLAKTPRQRFQSASDLSFAIQSLEASSGSGAARPVAGSAQGAGPWRVAAIAASVLLVLAVAALALRAGARAPVVSYTRLTLQTVTVFNARFAPDGETVVYSASKEGNRPDLYLQRRQVPEAQRLNLGPAHLLSISSKGEIALLTRAEFIRHRWFRGTLARMPLEGTAPREVIADVTDADWSRDGSELAIVHLVGAEQRIEFPVGTVRFRTTGHITDLRLSPRGDRIAFMQHPAGVDDRGHVAAIDLDGHETVLTPDFPGEEGLAWAPDGSEIYFSGASDEPIPRLTVQAVTLAGARRTLVESVDYLWLYDVSPRGDLLVVEGEEHYHVMAHTADRPDDRDVSWLDQSGNVSITGDGSRVLFTEFSIGPNYAVGYRSTGASPVVRIGDGTGFDVSKDGAWALVSLPTSPQQLTLYPTGAGQPRPLDRGGITDYQSARLFRDNRRVLACGREPDKPGRCYVQAAGGPPAAVTAPNTSEGVPSPDGRTIVARAENGTFVMYPLDGGTPRAVSGLSAVDTVVDWSPDGRSLVVLGSREIPASIDRVDLSTGARSRLANLAPSDRTAVVFVMNASVSDDGKSYAYSLVTFPTRLAIVHGVK
jgi:Tol biopolymer transport system component